MRGVLSGAGTGPGGHDWTAAQNMADAAIRLPLVRAMPDQAAVIDRVVALSQPGSGGGAVLCDAPAGRGKSFVLHTLISHLRGTGQQVYVTQRSAGSLVEGSSPTPQKPNTKLPRRAPPKTRATPPSTPKEAPGGPPPRGPPPQTHVPCTRGRSRGPGAPPPSRDPTPWIRPPPPARGSGIFKSAQTPGPPPRRRGRASPGGPREYN